MHPLRGVKYIGFLLLWLSALCATPAAYGQEIPRYPLRGRVVDVNNQRPLESVNIINMNTMKGASSDANGIFIADVAEGDSLYVSILGYQTLTMPVTFSMIRRESTNIYLSPTVYDLNEVVVRPHYLTGILEVDVRSLNPEFTYKVLKMEGIKTSDQLPDKPRKASVMNPVEYVAKFFSSDRKIEKMKKQDAINNMLVNKYDRDFLTKALGVTREELEDLLLYCNQDPKWVIKASDLEILEALTGCYDSWKQIKDGE